MSPTKLLISVHSHPRLEVDWWGSPWTNWEAETGFGVDSWPYAALPQLLDIRKHQIISNSSKPGEKFIHSKVITQIKIVLWKWLYAVEPHGFCIYIFFLKKRAIPGLFYLFSLFQYTVDSKQMSNNFLPMTGFKPRTSGIGSNRSTNWATQPMPWATQPLPKNLHFRQGFRFRLSPLASNLQVLSRYHCIDNLAAKYANI